MFSYNTQRPYLQLFTGECLTVTTISILMHIHVSIQRPRQQTDVVWVKLDVLHVLVGSYRKYAIS